MTAARVEVCADPAALAATVGAWLVEAALATTGPVRIALAGGATPRRLYRALAEEPLRSRVPWRQIHWYWGDERVVPIDDPASNAGMALAEMLDHAPAPRAQIHPMPVDGAPADAAARYQATLRDAYGADAFDPDRPLFDATLLGLGPDGHTASLLPGDPVLDERTRWVAAVTHGRPEARLTLTYPALESSRRVAFLVTGAAKGAMLRHVLAGTCDVPAARLRPVGEVVWFVDRDAWGTPG